MFIFSCRIYQDKVSFLLCGMLWAKYVYYKLAGVSEIGDWHLDIWPSDCNFIKIPVTLKQEKFSREYNLTAIREGAGGGGGEQMGEQTNFQLKLVLPLMNNFPSVVMSQKCWFIRIFSGIIWPIFLKCTFHFTIKLILIMNAILNVSVFTKVIFSLVALCPFDFMNCYYKHTVKKLHK